MSRSTLGQRGRRGAEDGAYRGPDRRARTDVVSPRTESTPGHGGVALLGVLGGAVWLTSEARFLPVLELALPGLRASTLVLSLVLAVTIHLHWRATGEASGAFVSTAAWALLGLAAIDLGSEFAIATPLQTFLRCGLSLVAAAWVGRAVLSTEVDAGGRPLRELPIALAATLVTALLGVMALAALEGHVAVVALHAVAFTVWLSVASLGLRRAATGAPVLIGWMSWLGIAMAGSEGARILDILHGDSWLFASASARVAGLLLATLGCVHALSQTAVERRHGLHHARLQSRELADAHIAEREFQAHELRNALIGVEAAATTLNRYRERLPASDRDRLDEVVVDGIAHLRSLTEPVATDARPVATSLWEVASHRASRARTRGMDVEVEGDQDVFATIDGRAMTQVLDNLLLNAVRHGSLDGHTRVAITVLSVGARAVLQVRDHGPGVPVECRELIFEEGVRLQPSRDGDGVGLPLSRQLVRQFGGELTVEEPLGGGARFVVSLPNTGSDGGSRRPHEAQNCVQVLEPLVGPGS